MNSKVRITFPKDPKFGIRYSPEATFHNIRDAIGTSRYTNLKIPGDEPAMILLQKILPMVTEASFDTLDEFLQVVQDHPLLKYADPAGRMYDLYKATAKASEKFLGPELFKVCGHFHLLVHNRVAHWYSSLLSTIGPASHVTQSGGSQTGCSHCS